MPRRKRLVLTAAGTIAAAVIAVALFRAPLLRGLGWMLVAEDTMTPADVIVLTVDVGAAGVLEAADLVHMGMATRVAVFTEPPSRIDVELMRRGLKVEPRSATWVRMLNSLGVANTALIPLAVAGTLSESEQLPTWCKDNGIDSVIVVSAPDHSKRLRRTLHRIVKGHGLGITVRPTRVSVFDPDHWWETRDGLRIGIVELEKLLLDVARHPLS
jgi:hypothetical protein